MAHDRDVRAFDDRAASYETGFRGRLHHDIAVHTADHVLSLDGDPQRVLDVGCGTGLLLRLLAQRLRETKELAGVDAAERMVEMANSKANDSRLRFSVGVAQKLPYPDAFFDLVVSTMSFDHWQDQRAGLAECARVLTPDGRFVLTDLFSLWLAPTMIIGRRGHARTKRRAEALLTDCGFRNITWRNATIMSTAIATK